MRKAMLLYNPLSGRSIERRLADVQSALSVLQDAGIEASVVPTRAASDATEQATQAIAEGCDTIFACGGDGTVHDVLQGMVGTKAALAIIPLGTANCLAHDLGLPLSPAKAASAALTGKFRRIAVGRIEYQDFNGGRATRYFSFIVGIGVDAHVFYELDPLSKRRFGMAAYCAKATRLVADPQDEKFRSWKSLGKSRRKFHSCWQSALVILVECSATSPPAHLSNATTSVWCSSAPEVA